MALYDLKGKEIKVKLIVNNCYKCKGWTIILNPITKKLQDCPACTK